MEIGEDQFSRYKFNWSKLQFEPLKISEVAEFKSSEYAINYILKDLEDNSEIWHEPPRNSYYGAYVAGILGALVSVVLASLISLPLGIFVVVLANLIQALALWRIVDNLESDKGIDRAQRYFSNMRDVYNIQLLYKNMRVELLYSRNKTTKERELIAEFHILYLYKDRISINEKDTLGQSEMTTDTNGVHEMFHRGGRSIFSEDTPGRGTIKARENLNLSVVHEVESRNVSAAKGKKPTEIWAAYVEDSDSNSEKVDDPVKSHNYSFSRHSSPHRTYQRNTLPPSSASKKRDLEEVEKEEDDELPSTSRMLISTPVPQVQTAPISSPYKRQSTPRLPFSSQRMHNLSNEGEGRGRGEFSFREIGEGSSR